MLAFGEAERYYKHILQAALRFRLLTENAHSVAQFFNIILYHAVFSSDKSTLFWQLLTLNFVQNHIKNMSFGQN